MRSIRNPRAKYGSLGVLALALLLGLLLAAGPESASAAAGPTVVFRGEYVGDVFEG